MHIIYTHIIYALIYGGTSVSHPRASRARAMEKRPVLTTRASSTRPRIASTSSAVGFISRSSARTCRRGGAIVCNAAREDTVDHYMIHPSNNNNNNNNYYYYYNYYYIITPSYIYIYSGSCSVELAASGLSPAAAPAPARVQHARGVMTM